MEGVIVGDTQNRSRRDCRANHAWVLFGRRSLGLRWVVFSPLGVRNRTCISQRRISLRVTKKSALVPLLCLIHLLISPLRVRARRTGQCLCNQPINSGDHRPKDSASLRILHHLMKTIMNNAHANKVLTHAMSVNRTHLIRRTRCLTTSSERVNTRRAKCLMLVLRVVRIIRTSIRVLTRVRLRILRIRMITIVNRARTHKSIITRRMARMKASARIMTFSLRILRSRRIRVPLVILKMKGDSSHRPHAFQSRSNLLRFSISAVRNSLTALNPDLPCTGNTRRNRAS